MLLHVKGAHSKKPSERMESLNITMSLNVVVSACTSRKFTKHIKLYLFLLSLQRLAGPQLVPLWAFPHLAQRGKLLRMCALIRSQLRERWILYKSGKELRRSEHKKTATFRNVSFSYNVLSRVFTAVRHHKFEQT